MTSRQDRIDRINSKYGSVPGIRIKNPFEGEPSPTVGQFIDQAVAVAAPVVEEPYVPVQPPPPPPSPSAFYGQPESYPATPPPPPPLPPQPHSYHAPVFSHYPSPMAHYTRHDPYRGFSMPDLRHNRVFKRGVWAAVLVGGLAVAGITGRVTAEKNVKNPSLLGDGGTCLPVKKTRTQIIIPSCESVTSADDSSVRVRNAADYVIDIKHGSVFMDGRNSFGVLVSLKPENKANFAKVFGKDTKAADVMPIDYTAKLALGSLKTQDDPLICARDLQHVVQVAQNYASELVINNSFKAQDFKKAEIAYSVAPYHDIPASPIQAYVAFDSGQNANTDPSSTTSTTINNTTDDGPPPNASKIGCIKG